MALKPFSRVIRALGIIALLGLQNGVLAAEISVLSYNVFMRTPTWIFRDNHDYRAAKIPQYLLGYDVVVLQEAFSRPHRLDILSALDASYPYNSGILGEDEFLSYNGGVIVLSRWPIIRNDQVILKGCEGSDCMVKKGAVYVSLDINGETVNLFGLHLQAQKEFSETRVAQFPQIKAFIEKQNISQSELVLVAGDFNVDYFSDASDREFSQLLNTVDLVFPENFPTPSYDYHTNSMVVDEVTERLDYILYSSRHLIPASASSQVLHFQRESIDLSDHHAVAAHFSTDSSP